MVSLLIVFSLRRYEMKVNDNIHHKDGPTIIKQDGSEYWYKDDKLHREDGPAITYSDDTQYWYKEGKLHREDGPAITYLDGTQYWYKDGKLHREDGPAINDPDVDEEWFKEGMRHREDGPAVIYGVYKMWYENDTFIKSNAMDFDVDHYLNNLVPPSFLSNVNYEVFNMNIDSFMYRKLPNNTIYRNCVINCDVRPQDTFIDCVSIKTTP